MAATFKYKNNCPRLLDLSSVFRSYCQYENSSRKFENRSTLQRNYLKSQILWILRNLIDWNPIVYLYLLTRQTSIWQINQIFLIKKSIAMTLFI